MSGAGEESGRPPGDVGEAVAQLADLRQRPAPGFLGKVRRRIDRRRLGSEMTDLTWKGLILVVVEYIDLVFGYLTGRNPNQGGLG